MISKGKVGLLGGIRFNKSLDKLLFGESKVGLWENSVCQFSFGEIYDPTLLVLSIRPNMTRSIQPLGLVFL